MSFYSWRPSGKTWHLFKKDKVSAQVTLSIIECVEILRIGGAFWLYKGKTSLQGMDLIFSKVTATRHPFHFKKYTVFFHLSCQYIISNFFVNK